MSWRDKLRPASFRGLAFFVEQADAAIARNQVEHEYPGNAEPFVEDLGSRARRWQIEGYVLGDLYQAQRDALVDACGAVAGPGVLVHPYWGTLNVTCRELATSESVREGGVCRLLFSFVEASDALAPLASEDPQTSVIDATGSLFTSSAADFEQSFDTDDQPAILIQAGNAQAQDFFDYLRGLQCSGPLAQVAAWRDKLTSAVDKALFDLATPFVFAASVQDLLQSLLDAVGSRLAAIEAFLGLCAVKPSGSFGFSSASQKADKNRDAVGRLFREHGAALAARASSDVVWMSYPDALSARDRALAALRAAQDVAGDQSFQDLENVARALSEALPLEPGTLPGIENYYVPETTCSLVLAYRLYDDVSRFDEIDARNGIENPMIVPGGSTLEVLARA